MKDFGDGASRSRMKETEEDRATRDRAYRTTAEKLLGFITEIERHEAEKADVQDQIKVIYEQANARGYDKKAPKVIVAERTQRRELGRRAGTQNLGMVRIHLGADDEGC